MDTLSGEICSSADETDDGSQISERHADQAERIELRQETLKRLKKSDNRRRGEEKVKS